MTTAPDNSETLATIGTKIIYKSAGDQTLYSIDSVSGAIQKVSDLPNVVDENGFPLYSLGNFQETNGRLVFYVVTPDALLQSFYTTLYSTDGTAAVTLGTFSDVEGFGLLSTLGNNLIYVSNAPQYLSGAVEAYIIGTDGTAAGTGVIASATSSGIDNFVYPHAEIIATVGGRDIVQLTSKQSGVDAYITAISSTDGTAAGTLSLTSLNGTSSEPAGITLLGNTGSLAVLVSYHGDLGFTSAYVTRGTTLQATPLLRTGALVSHGVTSSSVVIASGGALTVMAGGVANGAYIVSAGQEYVSSGGLDNGTTVLSGGFETVASGGVAMGATVITAARSSCRPVRRRTAPFSTAAAGRPC